MTTEQSEAQAQPAQGQVQAQGQSPNAGQNPSHRRRRRKRNKGQGKQAAAQPNGQSQQAASAQAPPPQNSPSQQPAQHQAQSQKPKPQKRFFQKSSNYGNGNGNGNGNGRMQNGNGNGNGGGARRKGKQRRQQVFVGPMDHSYRTANGNVADSGGSQNSQAEFRGMPHSGFYPESDFYNHAPAQVREDAPTRIYFFIEDLFILAKIQEVSKKLGIKVGFLKAGKETLAQLTEAGEDARPSLIVFDLNNPNVKPLTMIPKIKAKLKRGTSVIGFLSHLQGDLKVKAIEAGCDMVMPRSAFSQNLPNLLRRHGLQEEEMETVEA